ncbi:hypothetical protein JCM11641_000941 [Rhodosporidiobolus odoratus]
MPMQRGPAMRLGRRPLSTSATPSAIFKNQCWKQLFFLALDGEWPHDYVGVRTAQHLVLLDLKSIGERVRNNTIRRKPELMKQSKSLCGLVRELLEEGQAMKQRFEAFNAANPDGKSHPANPYPGQNPYASLGTEPRMGLRMAARYRTTTRQLQRRWQ